MSRVMISTFAVFFFAWVLLDIDVPSVLIMSVNHYLIKEQSECKTLQSV